MVADGGGWLVQPTVLAQALGLPVPRVQIINDFVAVGLALPLVRVPDRD